MVMPPDATSGAEHMRALIWPSTALEAPTSNKLTLGLFAVGPAQTQLIPQSGWNLVYDRRAFWEHCEGHSWEKQRNEVSTIFRYRKGTPQRTCATKILPKFRVNFLVRFAAKPLFYLLGSALEYCRVRNYSWINSKMASSWNFFR